MPKCGNCGAHVTEAYRRVFAPRGEVRVCPDCPNKVRDTDGTVREARSTRGNEQ